jgi:hypothetical protein
MQCMPAAHYERHVESRRAGPSLVILSFTSHLKLSHPRFGRRLCLYNPRSFLFAQMRYVQQAAAAQTALELLHAQVRQLEKQLAAARLEVGLALGSLGVCASVLCSCLVLLHGYNDIGHTDYC